MTDSITDWLRAQLDEDERIARRLLNDARPGRAERWEFCDDGAIRDTGERRSLRVKFTWSPEAEHIVRHDPARVLREIDATRVLLGEYEQLKYDIMPDDMTGVVALEAVIRAKAAVYADRPGYREDWRP